ncbi:MAG: potassium/proton antiporter [bacterium]|nr:potassium/proton antiporter [bacterium]
MVDSNTFTYILTGISILLLAGIVASKASDKLGVPALLLFLIIGMLAGSEGLGGIQFDYPEVAQALGIIALAFILFAGGLDTKFNDIKPVIGKGIVLSTLGVVITALTVGLFASYIMGVSPIEGLLLGAIVSSTDAAAVFAVLRSKKVRLKNQLKPLLELESGSNDPMAVFLTTGLIAIIAGKNMQMASLIPQLLIQISIGALTGYVLGKIMAFVINKLHLEYEGLYTVFTISFVLLCYGATDLLSGNAFLAVYIAGLIIGNSEIIHKKSILHFHDGLAWLMQITMFVALGLQVFPSQLLPIAATGLLMSAFLMLVGRPLSVFATLAFSRFAFKEKVMVSWIGLRGAVPIILATFPLVAGIPNAHMIFNVVFFIVCTSALLQGTSIPFLAKRLGLDAPLVEKRIVKPYFESKIKEKLVEISILPGSTMAGKRIVDLNVPQSVIFALVNREDEMFVPSGGTVLNVGDRILVASNANDTYIQSLRKMAEQPENYKKN